MIQFPYPFILPSFTSSQLDNINDTATDNSNYDDEENADEENVEGVEAECIQEEDRAAGEVDPVTTQFAAPRAISVLMVCFLSLPRLMAPF